ncbi:MAG TPA: phosphomethylpyrimidine synthase ThiC [Candidatus Cloacimonadota bacterium]|nr:phosphomethylpyrimidine synthase ThiC [Candidatus Cloacimonadota bacterium]HPT71709.1 phosphomethylpyrimidine synthase ThiC [Candidatus Cloacimonadota bacterium]
MTQLQSAQTGHITEEMTYVAQHEQISLEILINHIRDGKVVIPHNIHRNAVPFGIGKGLATKINSNIGTSEMRICIDEEIQKLSLSKKYGAHSVMDLSTGGDLNDIRKRMLIETDLILGTVPIYAVASELQKEGKDILSMSADMLFHEIEKQAIQGVDFMTVHAGITQNSLRFHEKSGRLLGIVSRGGSLLKYWMLHHDRENPLYEYYDRLLDICLQHDVTLSLGDGFRPGAISDATDATQISELLVIGELVERARKAGVQVMVEGPGHVPLTDIQANVTLEKRICHEAPFYVLGPLPTDFASGYDHITGAIGGALAASYGADFLCYVTPAEHLCLPDMNDVKLGIIASRIAAHIGDISKGILSARATDDQIAKARREMNWERIFELSVDPEYARERKVTTSESSTDHCSMCGELCAIRTDKKSSK